MSKLDMKLNKPLKDIFPREWCYIFDGKVDNVEFRNLEHFKTYVSKITQKDDDNCNVSYEQALDELISGKPQLGNTDVEYIRNLVRKNLLKRGLITNEIYERYKYNTEGLVTDVGKYVEGDPECVLTPSHNYINAFYELYVSISYPYYVTNEKVIENCIKLLATVEELERQHIYIKVTLIFADISVTDKGDVDMFMSIPLFSHRDKKTIETMSSVVNDRLLRKFTFALLEDLYKDDLSGGYGNAVSLSNTINLGNVLNEVELFTEIQKCSRT